jgi:hypothetical protein
MKVHKVLPFVAAAFLMMFAASNSALAAGTSSDANLTGVYACTGSGSFGIANFIPFTSSGNLIADGGGNFANTTAGPFVWDVTILGFPFQQVAVLPLSGYVIQPDGTGTAELNFNQAFLTELGFPPTFQSMAFALLENGVDANGIAHEFTMTATANVGPSPGGQIPLIWIIDCRLH